MATRTLGIVDLGSNSARVMVARADTTGGLDIVHEVREPLRLVRTVDSRGALDDAAVSQALAALADFRAVAIAEGADELVVVATAAVREAQNGADFVARIRDELGMHVRVLPGSEEALYAVYGALYGLNCENALAVDLGGGSMQIAHLRDRQIVASWSLPLGALRLSDAFLRSDPPTLPEIDGLRAHIDSALMEAGMPRLNSDEELVGTGGTIRNLARIDRRATNYPIQRVHGYVLTTPRVDWIARLVVETPFRARRGIPGLNEDRGDSIAGGALAIQGLMRRVEASTLQVSGQGLREGIVHRMLASRLPRPAAVRRTSLAHLAGRFTGWSTVKGERRKAIACAIADATSEMPREFRAALADAAYLVDVG